MRRVLTVLLVWGAMITAAGANGLFAPPGAKPSAMGNAGVAGTDDSLAIYYNPANLAGLEGAELQVEPSYMTGPVKGSVSLGNSLTPDQANGDFPFPAIYNDPSIGLGAAIEPASFSSKEMQSTSLLPFAAGYARSGDITWAFGAYVSGGGTGKWEDNVLDAAAGVDNIHALVDSSYGFVVYNVSAAKEVSKGLSLGLGLDIVTMQSDTKALKEYQKSDSSVLPAALGSYTLFTENDAKGYGLEGVLGVSYAASESLKTGLVLRSGANIALKGKAKYIQQGLSALGANYADAVLESDYDQNYAYPMTMGIGAQYAASQRLTLAVEADKNSYSSLKNDITYQTPVAGVFVNDNSNMKWDDTVQVRAGADYKVNEGLSLRAGVQNDPAAFTRAKATLLNSNQFNLLTYSVGAGWAVWGVQLDCTYLYTSSDKVEVGGRTYEYPFSMFQVGVRMGI